ncbi:MAG: universal stress protein [Nitrospirae bacterium]|nr:universal stress protein [Nitrospirota bacterium]
MKILLAYDGTLQSKEALRYGIRKAKEGNGQILVLHVFNSSLFLDYDATPHAEEMARIESARFVEDARRILETEGNTVRSRIVVDEGDPPEEILRHAAAEKSDIIIAPPAYRSLAKTAPCPVSVIPGYILVPLDNTEISTAALERIREEVKATGSKVILLGVVPVHIYSKWEKQELEKVKRETSLLLRRVKNSLNENGIETKEIIRSGYPDEEIQKAAGDYALSMIFMPGEGNERSELAKAATILSDTESPAPGRPLIVMHASS